MTLDELQKALKNRPLEHVDFEGLTIDNIVRTRDQRKAVLKQLQDWQEWFETFEKLFSVFKAEYDVQGHVSRKQLSARARVHRQVFMEVES